MPRKGRKEHFHLVIAHVGRSPYHSPGTTKSQANAMARAAQRIERNVPEIYLERCEPPCWYDDKNWPYGGDNVPEGKTKAYRAGPGWIEYEDAK